MILQINGLTLPLGETQDRLAFHVAGLLGVSERGIADMRVIRRSIDARRSRPPRFVFLLRVRLSDDACWKRDSSCKTGGVTVIEVQDAAEDPKPASMRIPVCKRRPVVVGCGPAGLFAALTLASNGISVLLLERGRPVPQRIPDVRSFWEEGVLNPESNVLFGEGGAGTFSDGKLTTRIKNPETTRIKQVFADMGAPSEILVDAHPHIGTDRLRDVVVNLRRKLIEMGCEIRFGACVTDFLVSGNKIEGVVVNNCEEIRAEHLVLAIGQSADDTYRNLVRRGVALSQKPFAVGVRVEHPQEMINAIQYGPWAGHPDLPPAEYSVTARVGAPTRSVYSFCMCPGGVVIGSSAEAGGVITNGMSRFRRDGLYANSAIVVNVRPEDLGSKGPLAGLEFRRRWEERAFIAGGGGYCAPAQRLIDFLSGAGSSLIGRCSFLPGVQHAELSRILPPFVISALKKGFAEFERKMPGFITAEAVLIGVETRTSSPVRILRNADGQGASVEGLFPCGEGAGYAGGIISSAVDGLRAAERLMLSCRR